MDPREKALWRWTNVENLDIFLQQVYSFYISRGFLPIILSRLLNLATLTFVVGFTTYLSNCIDYSLLRYSTNLHDVTIPQCTAKLSYGVAFGLWVFAFFWFMKLIQYAYDIPRLMELRDFYTYLLEIPQNDMSTISWREVVRRLESLRDSNPTTSHRVKHPTTSTQRMAAHDIVNRIMRKENYFIALINRGILDLSLPLPATFGKRQWLTRTLEWNISLCVFDFVFNQQGQIRSVFLKETHRKVLANGLRRRFLFAGIMNIIFGPFIMSYLSIVSFLRYFNEYHRNPGAIGSRSYSPFAEWIIREFNELPHLFQRRLNMSHPAASRYVNLFPNEIQGQVARFVSFVAGSFAAVLALLTFIDPELFLGFEISRDRTVLFYIGLFGTILAISRAMIPDEQLVFDPELSLRHVAEYTHYLPPEWSGKLHSVEVRRQFCQLYDLKIKIILSEIMSILLAPIILWYSLPNSSERIVDFFREHSVHVDGIGYVCSYAAFDGTKLKTKDAPPKNGTVEEFSSSNEDKMLKSYYNFVDAY
ncbi:hypothetical protein CANCADRAFT_28024, partial [Tortispora caseinolytica NRRL Y-17796]